MRDVLLTLFIFGTFVYIIKKPYIGVLVWSWLGYMSPHRMTWGFAYNFPFSLLVALVTFFGILFDKEKKTFPVTGITVLLIIFLIYQTIGYFFSLKPEWAILELIRIYKIQIFIFLTIVYVDNKEKLHQLLWVIALSLGYYGIKGGVFTILTGGQYRVWGPYGSFIQGNNELALAILMTIPLFVYLAGTLQSKWYKLTMYCAIGLMLFSAIGSYSRGAFLGLACMLFFLWLKMKNKMLVGMIVVCAMIVTLSFMPEQFFDRMNTIENYQEDGSAMGRINAWILAINVASDRFFGGGFRHWSADTFAQYAPIPDDVHDAHSIYFEVLGELGFGGLIIFLLIFLLAWTKASWVINKTKHSNELLWYSQLSRMIQVSLVAYATGGAFLGLAYWDLPYHLVAIIVILEQLLKKQDKLNSMEKTAFIDNENITDMKPGEKKWSWEK